MNHQKNDVVSVGNTVRPSVLVMIAALHAMATLDHAPRVYTLTDPCRAGRTPAPVRLADARDRRPRALSPAAQKIVDDARARKISNKRKTAALCRKAKS